MLVHAIDAGLASHSREGATSNRCADRGGWPELGRSWFLHACSGVSGHAAPGSAIFVLRCVSMEIHRSAGKHGVPESDVLHAIEQEIVSVDLEPDADPPKVLVIGPDSTGNLLEGDRARARR